MNALQRPSNRDYQSVVNWFDSRKPLVEEEATYIKRREDIVTLRSGRPGTEFDGIVERCLGGLDCFLPKRCNSKLVQVSIRDENFNSSRLLTSTSKKLFTTPELRAKSSDKHIHYYSPQRVDKLVSLLITTFIFVLLLVPVIAFYELSSLQRTSSPFDAVKV